MKSSKKTGTLVTFEGTEGAGKSSILGKLETRLKDLSIPALRTREPGGSKLAEKIRDLLLGEAMNPWTELFLYEAARSEHVERVILPALQEGKLVLCDRFTDSTLAYQGSARGLPLKEIEKLNRLATFGVKPKLTFWLDLDPAKGLERVETRTRFEEEGVQFQAKVRLGFSRLKKENPGRFRVIRTDKMDADQSFEAVWKELKKII